jgi:hypothetical protein
MTDQTQSAETSGRSRIIGIVLPCYLIGTFLYNLLVTAHEYPMRTEQVLTVALNVLALLGLLGVKASIPRPLFWIAMLSGIGLLALRLTGDDGWWTGHLFYALPPR